MKQTERTYWRWLALLLFCLLWGGGLPADAAMKAWAKYDDATTTLTFYYGMKEDLGDGEYGMNEAPFRPDWIEYHQSDIRRVVFDGSFVEAHPKSCFAWFGGCRNLTEIKGVSNLNTSEVTDMSSMFGGCSKLTTLDLSEFNTANVTDMNCMFYKCISLASLDLSNFSTAKVTDMNSMFYGCFGLGTLDLSGFNTAKVTDMSCMFYDCSQLQVIYASDNFVVKDKANCASMFSYCTYLQGDIAYDDNKTDGTYATINGGYLLSSDKEAKLIWAGYADGTLTFHYGVKQELGEGEYWPNDTFFNPGWLEHSSDIKRVVFDDSFAEARPKSCYCWFQNCSNLTEIEGMSNFNTSEVTDMSSMFQGCSSLTELDLSGFDTGNVNNMSYMFNGCGKLVNIYATDNFITERVGHDEDMFKDCVSLVGSIPFDEKYTGKTYATINNGYFVPVRPWAKYDETTKTLTFQYGVKRTIDAGEYVMNTDNRPGWLEHASDIKRVVFDDSFAQARPKSCHSWFYGCDNLTEVEGMSNLNTSEVTSMAFMFGNCSKLPALDVSGFNTEKVTSMRYMFIHCFALTALDLSKFNTANVTDMNCMFYNCSKLGFLNLSGFNTANVTDMNCMFYNCSKLGSLNLSGFNTANVTDMGYMFYSCQQLQVIYASDKFVVKDGAESTKMFADCIYLQGDIAYDANHVDKTYATIDRGYFLSSDKEAKLMWAGYADGTLIFHYGVKQELGEGEYWPNVDQRPGWLEHSSDIKRVVFDESFAQARPKSCYSWFNGCSNLTEIEGMSNLNTSEVTIMSSMFGDCSKLAALDVSGFNTEKVTNMAFMFDGCSKLAALDVSGFNTEKVTSMRGMFNRCSALTALDLSDFNTANVTDMFCMFYDCSSLASLDLSDFNTANVTNMFGMFNDCFSLASLDLSNFSTANVTDMRDMFYSCSQLQVIYASDKFVVKDDAESTKMFGYCTSLSGVIDFDADYTDKTYAKVDGGYFTDKQYTRPWAQLADGTLTFRYGYKKDLGDDGYTMNEGIKDPGWYSKRSSITRVVFDPSFAKVRPTSCCNWFYGCQMTAIEGLEYLNTSEVTTMGWMFYGCSKLEKLDLSSFDTRKVSGEYGMSTMFYGCSSLTSLDLSSFDTGEVTDMRNMFDGCTSLDTLDLTSFDTHKVNRMGYMFQNCSNLKTIYASDKFVTTADDFWGYYMFQGCGSLKGNIAFDPNYNDGTYASTDGYFLDKQYFRPWAQLADGTLTFRYGYKKDLGSGEYAIRGYGNPEWLDERLSISITRAEFDASFAQARPTTCYCWFYGCENLTDIEGLENLNTSEVTAMNYMFYNCSSLTSLDLSGFDTQKVTDMDCMFKYSEKLQSIYVSDKFSTANVTGDDMFYGCTSLVGNIAYDAAVTDKTHANIEGYFLDKEYVRPWAKIENGTLTFRYDYKKALNHDEWEFEMNEGTEQPLWNDLHDQFAKVVFDPSFAKARPTSCSFWFQSIQGDIEGIEYLNTSEVKYMYAMFRNSGISSLDLSGFDTRNVETMSSMFYNCSALTSLNLSSFDTRKVADMDYMFKDCDKLQSIYVSGLFTVDNVTNSGSMFYGCTSLQGNIAYDSHVYDKTHANASGYFIDRQYFRPWTGYDEASSTLTFRYGYKPTLEESKGEYSMNVPYSVSSSVTKAVFDPSFAEARPTDCSGWFANMENLLTVDGFEYLNTSEVNDMSEMFFKCQQLTSLDLSRFDTRKVIDMTNMFSQCYQLASLDISNFDTQQVTDMSYLFYGTKLTSLDLSKFDTQKVTKMDRMFSGCTELQSIYLGKGFSTVGINNPYEMFFGCPASLYCLPDCYEALRDNSVLAGQDKKVKPYVPINAQAEYGTLCVPIGSKLAEGTFTGFDKLYTVKKADTDKATVTLTEAAQIEPGVPYVYHRSIAEGAPAIIAFEADDDAAVAEAPQNDDSMLKGTFESTTAPTGSYVLQIDGMFHPVGSTTIPVGAYRAYLDLNTLGEDGVELSKALRMTFGGNATGIDSIGDLEDEPKVYFDLSGRRVARPQRGQVYILKGKKVKM